MTPMPDPDVIRKEIRDPELGIIHETYTEGELTGRRLISGGTGFTEIYRNGKLVDKITYKNYETSTHMSWDDGGAVIKDEWHITRTDWANALFLLAIPMILTVLLYGLHKRNDRI
jgi:hypothetical protein